MKKKKDTIEQLLDNEIETLISYVEISMENVKIGDIIYLEKGSKTAYEVLDVGSPFCLILDLLTNFCHLYRGKKVYKKQ